MCNRGSRAHRAIRTQLRGGGFERGITRVCRMKCGQCRAAHCGALFRELSELMLNDLKLRERTAELRALARVLKREIGDAFERARDLRDAHERTAATQICRCGVRGYDRDE